MKAIVVHQFGGPEVLQYADTPDPQAGAGQVVVRVRAAGVNPVETYVRSGTYTKLPALPYTPGLDAAGTVVSVGQGVTHWRPGDPVYTWGSITGTYAELTLCEESTISALPAAATFAQGAAVGIPCGAAWRALFVRGRGYAGETVLIHGATGAVGIAAVQLARAAGLQVIATGGSEHGRQLVANQGAHLVLPHDGPAFLDGIEQFTGGRGVDLTIEMLANANLATDLQVAAPNGRVVIVGSRGSIEVDPRATMAPELSVLGMSLINATLEEKRRMYDGLTAALETGVLRPVVGAEISLDEAARAHREVMEGDADGKIVLVPR